MRRNHLKNFPSRLAIFALLISTSAAPVFSASASNLPRLGPGAGVAALSQLELYANIETVGVVVSGGDLPATAQLQVRASGESTWHAAHALMRIPDGRLVGSLFGLVPATSHDVRVLDGAAEISGSITTQPDDLPFAPSAIVYVSASAPPGGDGSVAAPFQTIQEGVNHAGPGTQVLVADGVYHEAVTFPASGAAGHWIQLKAQGSGAILDGSQNRSGNIWTPVTGQAHVYFTTIGAAIAYLARDQQRFYNYDGVAGLNQGIGHNQVPMSEGWYFEASTLKLYVRSLDDPAAHSWQIPTLNHAFDAAGRDWLWIEGFEMRFYGTTTLGCGVCTTNASHLVIRKNNIHNLQLGVFINWNGSDAQGNDTRIEYNEISDPPVDEWPWKAIDGSTMEGTAIVVRGHIGAIVRSNQLHNFFNGIYTGSSAALENSALAFDADIYDNYIHHIGDDALEPEGACINNRFRNNRVDTVFAGISLAPITQGPTWVLRSSFTNYTGRAFKWDRASDGIVLVYHNTSWGDTGNINAMDMISAVHNAVLRNNIFQSRGYGVYEVPTGSTGHDWNNDNWYVRRAVPHFRWENVLYNSLADFCARTGLECQGYENPPGFTNPSAGDFSLLSSSPNVDRGVIIHGINDDFAGSAPDVGAFEYAAGPSISGNAGVGGATLSYPGGWTSSAAGGSYSFTIPYGWSGTVTPAKAGYTFAPLSRTYTNVSASQTAQNYASAGLTYAISGNAGVPGATLTYTDGSTRTATAAADGSYSFTVSYNWSGTITPSKTCHIFDPSSVRYNNVTADVPAQDYAARMVDCADVNVSIGSLNAGNYGVLSGGQATPSYPGQFDGAVHVASANGASILVSERQIFGSSFSESMGIPGNQLTTEYWFPWYDGLTMRTWITIGAPGTNSGDATVEVYIGNSGIPVGSYSVAPGSQVHPIYPGVFDGAVRIVSTNAQDIFASERQIYGDSFSETMGIPSNHLDTEYWFPLYDAQTMRTWISIGAPDTNVGDATVEVYIAGTLMGTYTVAPGGQAHPIYTGTRDGPVRVVSTNGQQIFVSERQIYGSSFSESLGVPLSQLTTEYYFPWYDGMTMSTAISLGAPSNNTGPASVDLYIGGVYQNTYTVPSGGRASAIYPGTFNGAVDVRSTNSQNIFVSERQIYGSSFAETMAIAANQLTTEYWFPWYDGLTMRTWVSIGAP